MKNSTKILLSAAVIVAFGAYVFFLKAEQNKKSETAAVLRPHMSGMPKPGDMPIDKNYAASGVASASTQTQTGWKDGTFTGPVTDAFYGKTQVSVTIANDKITDVQFPAYPTGSPTTEEKSQLAMNGLKTEVIAAQSANVNVISGATQTSEGFILSLNAALTQAQM